MKLNDSYHRGSLMRRSITCALLAFAAGLPLQGQGADQTANIVSPAVALLPLDIGSNSSVSGLITQDETTNAAFGISLGKPLTRWIGAVLQGAAGSGHTAASAHLEFPFHDFGALIAGVQIDNSDQLGTIIGVPVALRFAAEILRADRFSIGPLLAAGAAERWDHPDAQSVELGRDVSGGKIGGFGLVGLRVAVRPIWAQFSYGWSKQKGDFYHAAVAGSPPFRTDMQLYKQFIVRAGFASK
jgi:hypothetical protein